ncbi:PLAT/LH2 domain-containing protein [Asanoa hainanensis]|uniref:PLAT/LH2 domain-containing protein n=1 Tax=Asanoa hainanensis TaxID=560556 RepID=A0A239N2U6_9ACTN|nr:PLAT/LH2 domain-containing protein [Asanoa hainanensis]SNT48803.1 PLAT/LH2 domain-containing protein [Asanoa hainanensis]
MSEPVGNRRATPYLLLLAQSSTAARRDAARQLREAGITVVAQYGRVAVEVVATTEQIARVRGAFADVLRTAMKAEHLERLTDEQRTVVRQWNVRFTAGYRELRRDRTRLGRSWGDPRSDFPAPYSPVEQDELDAFVADYEQRTGRRAFPDRPDEPERGGRPEPFVGQTFQRYERLLAERLDDPTAAYHLARIAWRLGPTYRRLFLRIDPEFLAALLHRFFQAEATCWEMTGEISVGLVFVESADPDGPRFDDSERDEVCQEILDGLNWLAAAHPGGDLSWVYDLQFTRIGAPNGDEDVCGDDGVSTALEAGWRDPAMGQVTFNGTVYAAEWASVGRYREDMRVANDSAHALVIFVTPYANCWHAYAGSGRVVLADHNDWGNWGRSSIDRIAAHEVAHLFGAADEYTGSGTPCSTCDSLHGCDQIPNGNCGSCARPQQSCMMGGNDRRICAYTRGQIGWSTLFVELTTGDVDWAGTDDDVWLDIGDREFELDTASHDDRERDNREGYALWAPDVTREAISRVLIRKGPDGSNGGWRLAGLRLWHEGTLVCDQPSIDRWLEDDTRVWIGCVSATDLVNELEVRITTGDVSWAGTDDDITLTLGGRSWDLDNPGRDDFERGNTDTFVLDPGPGLRLGDLTAVRVDKSPDGSNGGWRLAGVRIVANGTSIYDNPSIDRWLEDNTRTWSDTI